MLVSVLRGAVTVVEFAAAADQVVTAAVGIAVAYGFGVAKPILLGTAAICSLAAER